VTATPSSQNSGREAMEAHNETLVSSLFYGLVILTSFGVIGVLLFVAGNIQ
jgi:hypothetical protein